MPFLTERARWKLVFGGRGGGKTESIAKALLLLGKQRPIRVLCAREVMQSIKQSVHAVLQTMIGVLGMDSYYSIERDKIFGPLLDVKDHETGVLKKKRTEFFFVGLRDLNVSQIKSYHDIQICWVEEAANISKRSLRVLGPTVRRAQGSDPNDPCEIWMSWNPTHEHDAVQELLDDPPEDSLIIRMGWEDNPWFDQSGLKPMMEEMRRKNPDEYAHVWGGECMKYWEGQVFLNELKQAEEEGRIGNVPYRSDAPCEVAFDIGGAGDQTALWVFQSLPDGMIHFIDYHEKVQSNLDYFLHWIESRPYIVSKFWLPHDARQRHAGMAHSYESLVRSKGKRVQIVPGGKGSVAEGINTVRTLAPRMRIDKDRCARGLEALRNYRFEIEEDKGTFKSVPVHDKFSHGCLTGDSLVDVEGGAKRIDRIVAGDRVWTPAGYADVTWAGAVKQTTDLVELRTGDGRILRCTPEHKILTNNGFLAADRIRYTDSLLSGLEYSCSLIGLLSKVTHIGFRAIITGEISGAVTAPVTCTVPFGQTLMGRFLTAITSTIRTAIRSTTTSLTWNWSSDRNICASTPSSFTRLASCTIPTIIAVNEPQSGTGPKLAMSGTLSTAASAPTKSNGIHASVRSAVNRLCRRILSAPSSATSIAKCLPSGGDAAAEWVYDLTVRNHACYRANGILVSNSDAMRYACTAYRIAQEIKHPPGKYHNSQPFRGDVTGWMAL